MAEIPIGSITPNKEQPRRNFHKEGIEELARSIQVDGVIQPIVVRSEGDRYQLVVGERRWRAARLAGLETIPAIIQNLADDRMLEVALVENIQREDLNPIEVALALEKMADELQLSHEELAHRTGKDRTTITNLLRLLRLPADIQQLLAERRLSMGHARALLSLEDPEQQITLAEKAAAQGMSVRDVERTVRNWNSPDREKPPEPVDPNVAVAIEEMERVLGTRVRVVATGKRRGRIEIEFRSEEELDRIYVTIVGDSE